MWRVAVKTASEQVHKHRLGSTEVLESEWLNWAMFKSSPVYGTQILDPVLFGSDRGCVMSVFGNVVLSDITWVVIIPFQSGRPGRARESIAVHRKDTQRHAYTNNRVNLQIQMNIQDHPAEFWHSNNDIILTCTGSKVTVQSRATSRKARWWHITRVLWWDAAGRLTFHMDLIQRMTLQVHGAASTHGNHRYGKLKKQKILSMSDAFPNSLLFLNRIMYYSDTIVYVEAHQTIL